MAASGGYGSFLSNLITNMTVGIRVGSNCSTLFSKNTIAIVKDCAAVIAGGVFHSNIVFGCPTGVVVRSGFDAGVPTAVDQAPSTERAAVFLAEKQTFEVQLVENTIHTCDADGILVAGGGRIERNHVFACRTGINVVARPPTGASAGATSTPSISQNSAFDCQIGVVLASDAVAVVSSNDAFDNAIAGISCEAGSTCVVEANRCSSANDRGALEISREARCQVNHNVVRNQFSPAFNKGLSGQRAKDRQKEAGLFAVFYSECDTDAVKKKNKASETVSRHVAMRVELEDRLAVLAASGGEGAHFEGLTGALRRSASETKRLSFASLGAADNVRSASAISGSKLRSIQQLRNSQDPSLGKRGSTSALLAKRGSVGGNSSSAGGVPSARSDPIKVLIHVLSHSPMNESDALDVGSSLAATFQNLGIEDGSVQRYTPTFTTIVTANPAAVLPVIKSQNPKVCIVVVPPQAAAVPEWQPTSANSEIFNKLQRHLLSSDQKSKSTPAESACAPVRPISIVLSPQCFQRRVEAQVELQKTSQARQRMISAGQTFITYEAFAALHANVWYDVEDSATVEKTAVDRVHGLLFRWLEETKAGVSAEVSVGDPKQRPSVVTRSVSAGREKGRVVKHERPVSSKAPHGVERASRK
jgi:hypothetical protein